MADHLRRQIREAAATGITGLPTTGSRVYQSRVHQLQASDLPAWVVETDVESILTRTLGAPRLYERSLRLTLSGYAKANADLDDTLDQMCMEVEVALAMPCAALGDLVKTITLVAVDITLTGEADQSYGRITLSYDVLYIAAENAPDVPQ